MDRVNPVKQAIWNRLASFALGQKYLYHVIHFLWQICPGTGKRIYIPKNDSLLDGCAWRVTDAKITHSTAGTIGRTSQPTTCMFKVWTYHLEMPPGTGKRMYIPANDRQFAWLMWDSNPGLHAKATIASRCLTDVYTHSAVWNAPKIAHSVETDVSAWYHVHSYWSATYLFDRHKLPNLCQGSIYYGSPNWTNARNYAPINVAIKAAYCTCLNSVWNLISIKSYFLFSIISRYWDGTCSWR